MKRKIELLAPGGDVDSIKAAIAAGADAIYCGMDKFNARNRAENISFEELQGILRLAHSHHCQVFITLNIIIVDSEFPALIGLLNRLINTSIDGVIVQDLGMFYLLSKYFTNLNIHASTQLTTHNEGQILFLSKLLANRVNLSRELNLQEITSLTKVAHQKQILTEVFVHGSYCLSFSGICYMSSVQGGNSGNRGRCSQPCRDQYLTTAAGKDFPLNLKDNSAFLDLKELDEAGVDSLKIEGRIKKYHYVFSVVESWRKQLQRLYNQTSLNTDNSELYQVFNRDFSNSFLKGDIHKDMFIDNPRDHSAIYISELNGSATNENIELAKKVVYDDRTEIINQVKNKIEQLSVAKTSLTISISGQCGIPLKMKVTASDHSFEITSDINLVGKGTEAITSEMLMKRLKAINETEYFIGHLEMENLQSNVFLPFKELTTLKKILLFILNDSRETIDPIDVPVLKKHTAVKIKPSLSVLISSPKDVFLLDETIADIYFELPGSIKNNTVELTELFRNNERLIPWFPAVIIGEDYTAAVEFIQNVQPKSLVTNNTGIAYEAYKRKISWIAGPYLNTVNSYGLLCLKENFNCSGLFISNEISKTQIAGIKKPEDFNLYYSMYHPIVLMTSRQCLFHQTSGCEKHKIDDSCIQHCEKSVTLTNLKKSSFYLEKAKGNYHRIFNEMNYLNTSIVIDFPNLFSGFFIDLRNIKTKTKVELSKPEIIKLFENYLTGNSNCSQELKQRIYPTTNTQYKKGI